MNRNVLKLIVLSLVLPLAIQAQDFKITHGPYLCDMTSDGVTVVWTTNKPALSWVELAPDNGKSFYEAERPKYYETVAGRKLAYKTLHRVRLSNLLPATNYRYRIYSKEVTGWEKNNNLLYGKIAASDVYRKKPFLFRTFPQQAGNVSFIVFNDVHGRSDQMKELCKNVDFKQIDFVSFNGDMANSIESEDQMFTDYIDASVEMFASETPIMHNRGNHETRGVFADRVIDYFPTRDGRFYQLYKVGQVCFLVLDCGEDKPDSDIEYSGIADYDAYRVEEAEWLRKVVETKDFKEAPYRVVFLHIPPAIGDWHGNEHIRQLFIPILNTANIDVMFSGHTHRYSFHPADSKINFPVVVNDNNSLIKCDIDKDKIRVRIEGVGDKDLKTHEFGRK